MSGYLIVIYFKEIFILLQNPKFQILKQSLVYYKIFKNEAFTILVLLTNLALKSRNLAYKTLATTSMLATLFSADTVTSQLKRSLGAWPNV